MVKAGETGVCDAGVLQIRYILLIPSAMFGVSMGTDFWVENLPSQVPTCPSARVFGRTSDMICSTFKLAGTYDILTIKLTSYAMYSRVRVGDVLLYDLSCALLTPEGLAKRETRAGVGPGEQM